MKYIVCRRDMEISQFGEIFKHNAPYLSIQTLRFVGPSIEGGTEERGRGKTTPLERNFTVDRYLSCAAGSGAMWAVE